MIGSTPDTVRNILEVSLVLIPVILAMLHVSKKHEREAGDRLKAMLDAFAEHEKYDRRVDAELMKKLNTITKRR